MKRFITIHKKLLILLLILFVVLGILANTFSVSKKDSSGHWKIVCHQALTGNPHHSWEGYLYYYGMHAPKEVYVKRVINGQMDEEDKEFIACEKFTFWDPHSGDGENGNRIFFKAIAPSLPSAAGYCVFVEGDKPETMELDIEWKEGKEIKHSQLTIEK